MKHIYTLIFVVLATSFSFAQSFSVSSLSEEKPLDGTNEVAIEVTVTNLTSDTLVIAWERTEAHMPSGWTNYICDAQKCYGPITSSETFFIVGNGTAIFSMHVIPTTTDDYAELDVKFYPEGDVASAVTGTYVFGQPNNTNDFFTGPIEIYPNPATSYFQVENSQKVGTVEVFNLLGVKVLESNNARNIDIHTLKSGLFVVRLLDKSNKVLTTQRLQKN